GVSQNSISIVLTLPAVEGVSNVHVSVTPASFGTAEVDSSLRFSSVGAALALPTASNGIAVVAISNNASNPAWVLRENSRKRLISTIIVFPLCFFIFIDCTLT